MKTVKTASKNRANFTYTDVMGVKHTLHPGDLDPATGEVMTAEWIAALHRMDDSEVYNNVKNSRAPVEDWEKATIDAWKEAHPYEDMPTRMHVALDGENEDGNDIDKGYIAKASVALAAAQEDTMLDRLREVVEMLDPDRRELYRRIVVEEESMEIVARDYGVSKMAISLRMGTVKKQIMRNFKK